MSRTVHDMHIAQLRVCFGEDVSDIGAQCVLNAPKTGVTAFHRANAVLNQQQPAKNAFKLV